MRLKDQTSQKRKYAVSCFDEKIAVFYIMNTFSEKIEITNIFVQKFRGLE